MNCQRTVPSPPETAVRVTLQVGVNGVQLACGEEIGERSQIIIEKGRPRWRPRLMRTAVWIWRAGCQTLKVLNDAVVQFDQLKNRVEYRLVVRQNAYEHTLRIISRFS